MLPISFWILLLTDPPPTSPDELPSAERYAAAGEAHLKRATTSTANPLDEFQSAHTNFDSAFLVDGATVYLCRALTVADLALRTATFTDEQERLYWEETRLDDLDRLRQDAAETRRPNCRFDENGKQARPRVALLGDAELPKVPPSTAAPLPGPSPERQNLATPSDALLRRTRAQTAAGAAFTGAGLAFLGLLAGVLDLERQRAITMRGMINTAESANRKFTLDEDRRFVDLKRDLLRGRDVAIGVGVAGLVSVGTGVALLATRKRTRTRSYAVQPYGGPQGGGAVLRLKF